MTGSLTDMIELDQLDTDGALRETSEAAGVARGELFKKAGIAGAGLLGAGTLIGALPQLAAAKSLPQSDVAILNFALTLEYLEATFYTRAVHSHKLKGRTRQFAELVARHERTHEHAIKKVLGSKAVKKPRFDFDGTTHHPQKFRETSFALENVGVHAYLGQAGNIKTPKILLTAATIVTVEARHAAAIAELLGHIKGSDGITPDGAFDVGWTKGHVLRAVEQTGFIVSGKKSSMKREPNPSFAG